MNLRLVFLHLEPLAVYRLKKKKKKRKKIHIGTLSETPFLTLRPQTGVPVLTPLIRRSHTKPGRDNCDSSAACPSLSLSTFLSNERRQQLSLGLISQVCRRRRPTVEEQVRSSGDPSLQAHKVCRLTLTVRVTMA